LQQVIFFVGPQKAGTSWIDSYLRWHGGVDLPKDIKETMFFDKYYAKGKLWYDSLYPVLAGDNKPRVEVAPTYFAKEEVRERINSLFPKAQIVVSIRPPAKRTFSSFLHEKRYGFISPDTPFKEAVQSSKLYEASLYFKHSQKWEEYFPDRQVHYLYLADMKDVDEYAKQLCALLKITYRPVPEELRGKVNAAATPRSYRLASVISSLNRLSRDLGLRKLRGFIARSPLKKIIYSGGKSNSEALDPEMEKWLMDNFLEEDWQSFQNKLTRPHEE